MPYVITGLDPAPYVPLFGADEAALDARRVHRMIADSNVGFPCRVTLADAPTGSRLLLLNHLSFIFSCQRHRNQNSKAYLIPLYNYTNGLKMCPNMKFNTKT